MQFVNTFVNKHLNRHLGLAELAGTAFTASLAAHLLYYAVLTLMERRSKQAGTLPDSFTGGFGGDFTGEPGGGFAVDANAFMVEVEDGDNLETMTRKIKEKLTELGMEVQNLRVHKTEDSSPGFPTKPTPEEENKSLKARANEAVGFFTIACHHVAIDPDDFFYALSNSYADAQEMFETAVDEHTDERVRQEMERELDEMQGGEDE